MPTRRSAARTPLATWPEHDDALVGRARPRRARTARTGRRRRRAGAARSGSRCTTTPCPRRESGGGVERVGVAVGVRARAFPRREHDRAAHGALAADEMRFVAVGGEPPLDDRYSDAGTAKRFLTHRQTDGHDEGSTRGRRRDRDPVRNEARGGDPRRRDLEPGAARRSTSTASTGSTATSTRSSPSTPNGPVPRPRRPTRSPCAATSVGPLHGLPITIKDAIETEGIRSTGGAVELADHVPTADAPAVARLKAAGAIVFGKTNLPRWSGDLQTYNEMFGSTNNPWDLDRIPGGSSGGAAAAVAAGFTSFELGTDIGGSVRIPSHCCGVFGLKPSFGVIPQRGYLDHVGGRHAPTPTSTCSARSPAAPTTSTCCSACSPGPSPSTGVGVAARAARRRGHGRSATSASACGSTNPACRSTRSTRRCSRAAADRLADAGVRVEEAPSRRSSSPSRRGSSCA